MKLSQLSLADYNQLDSIPVINQDLSATDFTPVANTYYKHIGTTTDLYTNGVIYYYNSTGYAALDGTWDSLSGKPNVVQSTGNSTSDVMSQKAVTDELNKKANSAELATVATSGSYSDLQNIPTDIAKIGNLSNPNLLINPNFAINQRGQTSYTGNDVYTVDRWLIYGATLTPVSNGVSLECNGNSRVYQRIEHNNELWGKTVTLTFCIDGTKKSASAAFPTDIPTSQINILSTEYDSNGYRLRITYYTTGILAVLLDCNQTKTIVVNWAKLEIGSVATEFSPPSVAEELIKCQRYYIKIGDAYPYITSGFVTSGGKGYRMALYLPTTMRDTPSVGGTPTWLARNANGFSTYTGSSVKSFTNAKVAPLGGSAYRIVDSLSAAGGDTNNTIFEFEINKLELDAEI